MDCKHYCVTEHHTSITETQLDTMLYISADWFLLYVMGNTVYNLNSSTSSACSSPLWTSLTFEATAVNISSHPSHLVVDMSGYWPLWFEGRKVFSFEFYICYVLYCFHILFKLFTFKCTLFFSCKATCKLQIKPVAVIIIIISSSP